MRGKEQIKIQEALEEEREMKTAWSQDGPG
jgi:hypothetical protein